MDQETKRSIKKLVLELRGLLEDDLEVVLKRYGIFTDKTWLSAEEIPKATDEILETRSCLEAAMAPELERGARKGKGAELYAREAGFTHLNRLVGLKVLEVRELIAEIIQTRDTYGGRSLYHRDYRAGHPEEANQADDALPAAFKAMCEQVSAQIKFVFDVESESSIIWPRYAAFKKAIDLINELPEEVWQEDEIIGWIYQFYNAEEKEAIRKRGKPKLPIEVAVINQFFTPRWVVKFLVDNTLGRLWLEMHPDSERVRAKCDYLVPEPLAREDDEEVDEDKIELDPESPINNQEAKARREPKRPQDLKLIDPACGTMHFGHYAFEVFQEIYRDARELGYVGEGDALSDKAIPLAILKRNLYGVDIDLRAVQLAALSLYVKARTAQREAGMVEKEAAKLPWQVNLVSADAHLTDGGMREAFLEKYADDPQLQNVWKEMFSEMEDIAQVGSLLRVEERFRQLLETYQPPTVEDLRQEEQADLPGMEQAARQMQLGDADATGAWSPSRTVQAMLGDLKAFASEALEEQDVNAQIFATEVEKALGLLDVLMQKYDVVVMNPPYGEITKAGRRIVKSQYPASSVNVYAAFLIKTLQITEDGYVGALTERLFITQEGFTELREKVLINESHVIAFADLWYGVLDDAMNRTAAYVLTPEKDFGVSSLFFDLKGIDDKEDRLSKLIKLPSDGFQDRIFLRSLKRFFSVPKSAFLYKLPDYLLDEFAHTKSFGDEIGRASQGLITGNNARFVRYHWEVPSRDLVQTWIPYAKGGVSSSFYQVVNTVVDYSKSAQDYYDEKGRHQGRDNYLKPGIGWGDVSSIFNAHRLSEGTINSQVIYLLPTSSDAETWLCLGYLNSIFIRYLLSNIYDGHHWGTKNIQVLPWKEFPHRDRDLVASASIQLYTIKKLWDQTDETNPAFQKPLLANLLDDPNWLINKLPNSNSLSRGSTPSLYSLSSLIDRALFIEERLDSYLSVNKRAIDNSIFELFQVPDSLREELQSDKNINRSERVWNFMDGKSKIEKSIEHTYRLMSFIIIGILEEQQYGIAPVRSVAYKQIHHLIIDYLEGLFNRSSSLEIESEFKEATGYSLDSWIDGPFIKWHTKTYLRRPIVWQISSENGLFSYFLYYHLINSDTLTSLRTNYLWRERDHLKSTLRYAQDMKDQPEIIEIERKLGDCENLDMKLSNISDSGWQIDFEKGVKYNMLPLQDAEVLRYKNMI